MQRKDFGSGKMKADKNELRWLFKWVVLIVLIWICNMHVLRLTIVHGISMEPTLEPYDLLVVWQWDYVPQKDDIVVTTANNSVGQSLIKRVAALEGEQVFIEQDGTSIMMLVPEGYVYLTGDNDEHSTDSRTLGCFAVEDIRGKVVVRIFPFTKIATF